MEKVRQFFRQNLIYFIIVLSCLVYLLYGFINVEKSGKTMEQIVADSAIIFCFGTFMSELFEVQGIRMGEDSDAVKATNKLHADTVEGINDEIDYLDEFCDEVTKETIKKTQIRFLNVAGIKYDDFVNKTYDLSKLDRKEKWFTQKWLRKARGVHITPLLSSELTTDDTKIDDPLYLGKTKRQYRKWSSIIHSFSKIAVAVIFGYYTYNLIENFAWGYLIWTLLQIMIFIVLGVLTMMNAYFFITDDLRNRKIRKIDWLYKFKIWVKKKKEEEERNANNKEERGIDTRIGEVQYEQTNVSTEHSTTI